jgi:hypothetical protein
MHRRHFSHQLAALADDVHVVSPRAEADRRELRQLVLRRPVDARYLPLLIEQRPNPHKILDLCVVRRGRRRWWRKSIHLVSDCAAPAIYGLSFIVISMSSAIGTFGPATMSRVCLPRRPTTTL